MKTLNIADENMVIKTKVELTENLIFREVNEGESYDLVINEYGIDSFWKSTNSKVGEITLEPNDIWLDNDGVLVNRDGFITLIKTYDVHFNNDQNANSKGFKTTRKKAMEYIKTYNGTD